MSGRRGKYVNHKGQRRKFTSMEELEEQRASDERYRQKKAERGMESTSEEEEVDAEEGDKTSESGEESDDGAPKKAKGVESLIEVQNPNRAPPKAKKIATITEEEKPELTRREREEIEKQKATAHYHMLHAQGKTAQARADLARLAIIKQQREDAAKRREAEKMEKEVAKQTKTAQTQKALGKKST